jgi:hypothetical protein
MTIHQLALAREQRSAPARERFWHLRRASHLALLDWLREQPAAADVTDEIDASISVIRQLAHLVGRAS